MQGQSPGLSHYDQKPLGYSDCGPWTNMGLVAESQPYQRSQTGTGIFTRSQAADGGGVESPRRGRSSSPAFPKGNGSCLRAEGSRRLGGA